MSLQKANLNKIHELFQYIVSRWVLFAFIWVYLHLAGYNFYYVYRFALPPQSSAREFLRRISHAVLRTTAMSLLSHPTPLVTSHLFYISIFYYFKNAIKMELCCSLHSVIMENIIYNLYSFFFNWAWFPEDLSMLCAKELRAYSLPNSSLCVFKKTWPIPSLRLLLIKILWTVEHKFSFG